MNLRMRDGTLWRTVLVVLCILVFFFVLHAKTAVYKSAGASNISPTTASKLWISGDKTQMAAAVAPVGGALAWLTVFRLYALHLHREPRVRSALLLSPPTRSSLSHLRRYLRPPPNQV